MRCFCYGDSKDLITLTLSRPAGGAAPSLSRWERRVNGLEEAVHAITAFRFMNSWRP
jgi:hypothetical protein